MQDNGPHRRSPKTGSGSRKASCENADEFCQNSRNLLLKMVTAIAQPTKEFGLYLTQWEPAAHPVISTDSSLLLSVFMTRINWSWLKLQGGGRSYQGFSVHPDPFVNVTSSYATPSSSFRVRTFLIRYFKFGQSKRVVSLILQPRSTGLSPLTSLAQRGAPAITSMLINLFLTGSWHMLAKWSTVFPVTKPQKLQQLIGTLPDVSGKSSLSSPDASSFTIFSPTSSFSIFSISSTATIIGVKPELSNRCL